MAKTVKVKVSKEPATGSPSWVKQSLLGLYGIVGVALSTFGGFKVPFAESNARDYWRHALAGIVLLLALITGIVSLAIYLFNANYFKSQIVEYVKTNNQRDLTLEGDLKVAFFPKFGLDAGKMSISQRNSSKNFASIESAHFQIAWWPLFLKQLQIEGVTLHGVHANLVRFKDGTTNLDDFFSSEDKPSNISFEIDSVKLADSSISLQDELHGYYVSMHNLNLETGKLANSTPGDVKATFRLESAKSRIDTKVKLGTHLLFDLPSKHYELANLEAEMEGDFAGLNNITMNLQGTINGDPANGKTSIDKLSVSAKGKIDNRKLDAKLDIPSLKFGKDKLSGSKLAFNTSLIQEDENLNFSSDVPEFEISGNVLKSATANFNLDLFKSAQTLQGKLSSPLAINLDARIVELPAISGSLTATHPAIIGKLAANMSGSLAANMDEQSIKLNLKTKIDDSNISGQLGMQNFAQPSYTLDMNVDTLNLDRYLATNWAKRLQDDSLPFDLAALKTLRLRGKFNAADLRLANLKMANARLEFKAEPTTLNVETFAARLYGGNTAGNLSINGDGIPQVSLKQKLNNIQFNQLLADWTQGEPRLSGKGNVTLELNGNGENMAALRKSISGSASVNLARGNIAGFNVEDNLLENKGKLGIPDARFSTAAKFSENTAFTELKSSFEISNGKALSSDLTLKSPTLGCKGSSEIMLENGALNFNLTTSINASLKRSQHGNIAELKGVTLPMQVNGLYTSPVITLDLSNASGMTQPKAEKANTKTAQPASKRK